MSSRCMKAGRCPREDLSLIILEADFLQKENTTLDPYDSDKMAQEFLKRFPRQSFTVGQRLVFSFQDMKLLGLVVRDVEVTDMEAVAAGKPSKPKTSNMGICLPMTRVIFEKAEGSSLNIVGTSQGKTLIMDWDFYNKMGIGGMDKFNAIFRRVFASCVFPPEIIGEFDYKHVKGMLLFGPPGTGKTLMVRQICKMFNTREPKVVEGPLVLDKYVGESEAIRRLFEDAEDEEKTMGPNSELHIIIFDGIDAICKARGSVAGNTCVNQLLAKIDQLNNILVIGTTNRKDLVDEALMRPGRMEIQIEIGLPDEKGREQILHIHTSRMTEHKILNEDVDIKELATLTKNFSGAEIEGLVQAAQSIAVDRFMKASNKAEVDPGAIEKLQVSRSDFLYGLENDVKPAFGTSAKQRNKSSRRSHPYRT